MVLERIWSLKSRCKLTFLVMVQNIELDFGIAGKQRRTVLVLHKIVWFYFEYCSWIPKNKLEFKIQLVVLSDLKERDAGRISPVSILLGWEAFAPKVDFLVFLLREGRWEKGDERGKQGATRSPRQISFPCIAKGHLMSWA